VYKFLEDVIESQQWLETLGDPLQKLISSSFEKMGPSGRQVKNLLNGTWLSHPLHPMLTDVPVGAYTATVVLDTFAGLTGNEGMEAAADLSLATGWAAGFGAAVTGLTDWSDTYGKERKVGLLHGVMMIGSHTVYGLALLARVAGARKLGVLLSNTGYAMMAGGAFLGGDEVFDIGYGVNHTAFLHGPGEFTQVMPEAELTADTPTKAEAGNVGVVLVKQGQEIYALDDTCVHAGCSLSGGTLEGRSIICPCHFSQYDLRDGTVINGPATMPEPHYDVRVQEGMIEVRQA
jgi:nitrite reductase/ring-hydroxylating ferredoxin subunit/uncharacterized membrane protein